ncbi:MAG TPA: substrate-binding domain-containing protein, partial [Opitutus sp.]|nr:substrate-binding domain-containing protein [Opitutus sp.]
MPCLRILTVCLWIFVGVRMVAAEPERVLRVAADPNNLPFSNERCEGFENRIAELVARELGARLEYFWWPQRRGFFRQTIGAGRADLVIGVAAGIDHVLTTRPYYRSTYVFVQRAGTGREVTSFDDPRLHELTIGVQMVGDDFNNTPPAHALSRRGMIENVRGYSLYGDYAQESPPAEIMRAVARGEIDVAVAWGPMAGYFARRQAVPLDVTPVTPERDGPVLPLTYAIAMGVGRGDAALKAEVDAVIERRGAEIAKILAEYGVPCLELKGSGAE